MEESGLEAALWVKVKRQFTGVADLGWKWAEDLMEAAKGRGHVESGQGPSHGGGVGGGRGSGWDGTGAGTRTRDRTRVPLHWQAESYPLYAREAPEFSSEAIQL